jgi:hypothetical protein
MTTALRKLLLLHAASEAAQHAHDAFVDGDADDKDTAVILRQVGEQIALAVGRLVKGEAAKNRVLTATEATS